ncbi:MAG: extracellular solute-binding protein [Micromonosporaceae bacterium]|nr:extracellular solute-binding protein [Micromonosporaceae bacterium]
MTRNIRGFGLVLSAVALVAAGCGGGGTEGPEEGSLKGEKLTVLGVWSGAEQENFKKVLDAFEDQTGATVTYSSAGDQMSTVLGGQIEGGKPPDVAIVSQPGLMKNLAADGALKPVNKDVEAAIGENYAPVWKDLGSVDGEVYGVWIKAANKSLMWYNTQAFEDAGVEEPKTWDEFNTTLSTLADAGTSPLSVAGSDGWTLTDWFENVYLQVAGPEKYDQLTNHEIPWTDQSVKDTLKILGDLWGGANNIPGGPKAALQVKFQDSVTNVFADNPKAAIVYEGDFVGGVIGAETNAKVGETAKFFSFPEAKSGAGNSVVGGGDVALALKDGKGAQGLLEFLAAPAAAEIWAKEGGFVSPNKGLDLSAYKDDPTRQIAKAIIDSGDNFRFDMSDLAPAAFGGTVGKGEWKALQDFLGNPTSVEETAKKLESEAAKAYK